MRTFPQIKSDVLLSIDANPCTLSELKRRDFLRILPASSLLIILSSLKRDNEIFEAPDGTLNKVVD